MEAMTPTKKLSVLAFATVLAGCAAAPTQTAAPSRAPDVDPLVAYRVQRDIELLASFLEGTWETIPQEAPYGDSTPMRLRIARVWPEKTGEFWLYAESVDPANEAQVLRQRIYRLRLEDGKVTSRMYRLPGDPRSFAGEWRKERPFAGVAPASLVEFEGCRVLWLRQLETLFAGGTEGRSCGSDVAGVANEHSDFYLASASLRALIQGFDASGKQVWGPNGPSEFRKIGAKSR
jgi:hypothetical protein